ncbi:hypothetical protein [Aliarcobacter butzleri]|uniref:hypothetical protein n=1 Tax=Aliarcobacter butzleri TaxID=28197 RepID=UPI00102D8C03|nr:hypothetical protein [Aliarcobacter butzleri]RZV19859.1 hypothetical protein D3M75_00670 [Aliarcobacter butzleri]
MNDKNLELVPDKDGFLFEIEDKIYLLTQVVIIFLFTIIILLVFYLFNFNLQNIVEFRKLGLPFIIFTIPIYIYMIIKTLYYIFIQKRRTIKFYTKYVSLLNHNSVISKVILEDIKKIYKLKLNLLSGKNKVLTNFYKFLLLLISPIFMIFVLIIFICTYITHKKIFVDNLVFITEKEIISGIGYELLNLEEKSKVDLYFKKYLNINLDEVETRWIFIPDK